MPSPRPSSITTHPASFAADAVLSVGDAPRAQAGVAGDDQAARRLARLAALVATVVAVVGLSGAFWWRAAEFAISLLGR